MDTCGTSPSRNSSATPRSPRSMKAPVKSSASSSRVNSIATANRAPRANERSEGLFAQLAEHHHEQVSLYADPAAGYRGIIAIHNTQLGPALGGTGVWNYESDEAALTDALRLARGMTYKAAGAGRNLAGGNGANLGDNKLKDREPLFRAPARPVETLAGRCITPE